MPPLSCKLHALRRVSLAHQRQDTVKHRKQLRNVKPNHLVMMMCTFNIEYE